jgi:stress response protein SCP2/uncharacterized protein (AIM24 family)
MKTLLKGQKLALESELNSKVFNIGINWDKDLIKDYDIDASLLLLSERGKIEKEEDFIFYNNPDSPDGMIKLDCYGNNNYLKLISFNLERVANSISKILLVLTIDNGLRLNQRFGNVKNLNIDVLDADKKNIYLRYPIEGLTHETAIITMEIYKHNNTWKVNAVGIGFNAGLDKILMQYGSEKIKLSDDSPGPSPVPPANTGTPIKDTQSSGGPNKLNVRYNGVLLEVDLKYGQGFKAESNAVASKDPSIDVETKLDGNILGSLGRLMAGERIKLDNIKAKRGDGKVSLSPKGAATQIIEMDGTTEYFLQQNSFFGSSDTIEVSTIMQNPLKGLLIKEGFSINKVSGVGTLIIKAANTLKIEEVNLDNGQEFLIDNRELIAWPATVVYRVHQSSKELIANYKSGTKLVCQIIGPGKIYVFHK